MKNLLVICLDDVRYDHVGLEYTPNLVQMLPFEAPYCYTTATWTLPAHASLFTGKFPIEHHAHHPDYPVGALDDHIATRLNVEKNYYTGIWARETWFKPEFGLTTGFLNGSWRTHSELDHLISRPLFAFVEPWFLFVHSFIVHNYLTPMPELEIEDQEARWKYVPDELKQKYEKFDFLQLEKMTENFKSFEPITEEHEKLMVGLYRGHLQWADKLLKEFLLTVNPETTDVIVFSDHGEALGDSWNGGKTFHHRQGCTADFMIHVPVRANFPLPQKHFSLKELLHNWWWNEGQEEELDPEIFVECLNYRNSVFNIVRILDGTQKRVNFREDVEYYAAKGSE